MSEIKQPKISLIPEWQPPTRDPGFAVWLQNTLESNYGPPLQPYEIIGQLEAGTGFTAAELCELFGYPEDHYANPDQPEESDGEEREDWWNN